MGSAGQAEWVDLSLVSYVAADEALSRAVRIEEKVEIYSLKNAGTGWTNPVTAPFTPPLYPRMMLLPTGRVFFTGQGGDPPTPNSWLFDPAA